MKCDEVFRTDFGFACNYRPTIVNGPVFEWRYGYTEVSASRDGVIILTGLLKQDLAERFSAVTALAQRVHLQLARGVEPEEVKFE